MKKALLDKCLEIVQEKITLIQKNINLAQEASQDDTKSSAGDKYETTRAMMQIEIDNYKKRLLETQVLEDTLLAIDASISPKKVTLGALIITNQGVFLMSVGLGQVRFEDKVYFVISPDSPIGKLLMDKKTGDSFLFNQKTYEILTIE